MCKCCFTEERSFEIDYIASLASAGTIKKRNLQVLCKACHVIKTAHEFKIVKIGTFTITIEDDFKKLIKSKFQTFKSSFL